MDLGNKLQSEKEKEELKMWKAGKSLNEKISQILRAVSHTCWPRFPFLQLFQYHPIQPLEEYEALSSVLSNDVTHLFTVTKKPLHPAP